MTPRETPPPLKRWLEALEQRHLADLTFRDVRRGIQALSSRYVAKRGERPGQGAFGSAAKRAAYAMFYGPLHFLTVQLIVEQLDLVSRRLETIVDLGCGTGAASAAWALAYPQQPKLIGIDAHPWAVKETSANWRELGLRGRTQRGNMLQHRLAGKGSAIVMGYSVNELAQETRATMLSRLLDAGSDGARLLVVEPIARRLTPWWDSWASAFQDAGGRADEWRFATDLPQALAELDRAASLDHRELTARSLCL